MVSDSLFATSKKDELIHLMRRFNKALDVPEEKWNDKAQAEYMRIMARLTELSEQVPGATWEWAKEVP